MEQLTSSNTQITQKTYKLSLLESQLMAQLQTYKIPQGMETKHD